MLELDSLVIDLIFRKGATIDPEALMAAIESAGEDAPRKILDPDMQDPRFEMELSPSMPFRRRGERRLMLIDDSVAPMRRDPRTDFLVPLDLRPEKERLIALCESLDIRLGRIFALGSWGDAVLVARSAVDLRGVELIAWALDPTVDVDGKPRAGRLSPAEFEAKLAAYDKRLEERSENDILADLAGARLERRGDYLVVDVLEDDGTWDLRRSLALEQSLAAVDKFSLIPGAPASRGGRPPAGGSRPSRDQPAQAEKPAPPLPPLRAAELAGRVVLIFPPERFDLEVAARLGIRDYDAVLNRADPIPGSTRDLIYRDGADFIAPLAFLSEVFVDGKPLSRPQFENGATRHDRGVRTMPVHCPRFGPVVLFDVPDRGRFITSSKSPPDEIVALLA